ncbi:Crp/Fnr family transcriptional regulator [Aquimarina sp. 2201CG5-10]|uniref:Crp/Fnr family transcriptional regulator n=1 Tax=Aquimarina callyspongiae TaxID=3098150 RepID=UPI002AB52CC4|nr:Crp/Fnr family transcriptional regulator [Aquimarina sp. 2201CG5-10]MDY8135433.1 Crp/Fnr family transcriptional regulator [Aquimarina sp. 2201CG5-10]
MEKSPLIKYISNSIDLTQDEVDIITEYTKQRKYLKGQFIVQQGDICRNESFVVNGCAKTFHIDKEGQEHIVTFAIENWWASDFGSFITQTPADYNVQCLENTEVVQFSYESLQIMFDKVPKMERFVRVVSQKAYVASQKRIIRNFSMSAREQYLKFKQLYPQIEQRVPQYMIASYLGITKEFLSKIKSQLISEQ